MYLYQAYGLHIRSTLPLSGLVRATAGGPADVTIEEGPVALDRWHELNDDGMKLTGVADGVMRFHVMDGERITVELLPGADEEYAQAILTGELFAALLRQRGLLALHASCVAKDGHAVGFIGNSGWGKSTLAMHFVEQGYRLLGDDVLAVSFEGGEPVAIPGYPQVKLREDAGARYAAETFDGLRAAHSQTDKRLYRCDDAFQEEVIPLWRLYLLEPRRRETTRVVVLPRSETFAALVAHTRGTKLLKNEAFTLAHFSQVQRLMESVPVSLLHREMALDALPDAYEAIQADLGSPETLSASGR